LNSDARGPGTVRIRAIRQTDETELQRFYAGLSPESRRTRFFAISPGLSQAQSHAFCTTDHDHREGFVAVAPACPNRDERIVGHLCLEPDGAEGAEVAIAVADAFQHHGIGRRLLLAGTTWARREHITRLTATMLVENAPIHRLLVSLGLPTRVANASAGVSEITIDLAPQSVAA
jgi:GNAT superfamily N-acetyltransferase